MAVMEKLFRKIFNRGRNVIDNATAKLSDPAIDGKYAIADAQDEIKEFTGKIQKVSATIYSNEKKLSELKASREKFVKIQGLAESKQNTTDAESAAAEIKRLDKQIKEKESLVKTDRDLYTSLMKQKNEYEDKIIRAEENLTTLAARNESAKLRKDLANATLGLNNSFAISELDSLTSEVEQMEAEAAAAVQMADESKGSESLIDKYEV